MSVILDDNPDTPYKLQEAARHTMICRLYQDILADMTICEIENWDKTEYIKVLHECINHFILTQSRKES